MSDAPKSLMDFIQEARARIQELDGEQLTRILQEREDVVLVDIREHAEHEQGHLKNAMLIPRGILEAAADLNYPKHVEALYTARNKPVVLYCATGGRSALGAVTLQLMGFQEVYSLAGGIAKWQEENRPVAKEASYV
jgi:rhodanese-related sulfurtransferase